MTFYFPEDGSQTWLRFEDALLAVGILQHASLRSNPRVLEIGVWKGGCTSTVLMNVPGSTVTGVDPYPEDAARVRPLMLGRLSSLGVADRFTLCNTLAELPLDQRFDVIHVDGNHSEANAWEDISRAYELLDEQGVMIIDDVTHKWLPGVASAAYRFCSESELRMFALTRSKGYFSRVDSARHWHREISREAGTSIDVTVFQNYRDMTGHPYFESSDVMGQPVLLVAPVEREKPASVRGRRRRVVRLIRRFLARFV